MAKEVRPAITVVAHPCDENSLRGASAAAELGIIVPILVGPVGKITAVAKQHGIDIARYELVDAPHSEAAAAKAVELIRQSRGELLMKGSLHTDELMREVTAGTTGLRTARRISHVFIMDVPTHSETLFITDAAINIFPDLEAKRDIVQNAINASGCHPFRRRDGDSENSVHHRRRGALQNGRAWPNHRRDSRRAACFR
jgi:phosphate acetyltransferase